METRYVRGYVDVRRGNVVLESIKLSRSADEQLVGNSGKWNSFKIHILGIVFQSIAVMFYFKH